jgi:thioredoxin 1
VPSRIVPLNDHTFGEWTENEVEVTLVSVGAKWCSQSQALAPVLEELSTEYAGKVRFAHVDFDESPAFVKKYEITAVPTVLLYKRGACEDSIIISCVITSKGARESMKELIARVV